MRNSSLLLFSLSFAGACVSGCDERPVRGCPIDEVCSPATPHGLLFSGASPTGAATPTTPLPPVAVGGIERITLEPGDSLDHIPAFDAVSSDPAIAIEGVLGEFVTVRGASPGDALLRILDRDGGGALLDRTSVSAAAIDRVVAGWVGRPTDLLALGSGAPVRETLFAPGPQDIALQLVDASGRRLVDESMTIDGGATPITVAGWDAIHVEVPETGLDLAVTAGGRAHSVHVGVPTGVDGVELVDWILEPDATGTPVISSGLVCAYALQGGARIASASTGDATFSLDATPVGTASGSPACTQLHGTSPGPAQLTIAIGGASATFDVVLE